MRNIEEDEKLILLMLSKTRERQAGGRFLGCLRVIRCGETEREKDDSAGATRARFGHEIFLHGGNGVSAAPIVHDILGTTAWVLLLFSFIF